MHKSARIIGLGWMITMAICGVLFIILGLFWGAPGISFENSAGDIWIAALLAIPGYFSWKWGECQPTKMRS